MLCGSAVKAQFCFLNGNLIPFLITLAPGVALGCLNTFLEIVGHSHCIKTSGCWNEEEFPRSSSQSWLVTDVIRMRLRRREWPSPRSCSKQVAENRLGQETVTPVHLVALQRRYSRGSFHDLQAPGLHNNCLTRPRHRAAFLPWSFLASAFWIQSSYIISLQ